jgi:hypothetical protein
VQPIHNPTRDLHQQIESDVERFLKRGGQIKIEPIKQSPVRPIKQFSLNTSKKEFKEAQARRKNDSKDIVEPRFCKASGLYHIYQGSLRLSTKGYFSEQIARMQAAKIQEKINLEARMKTR